MPQAWEIKIDKISQGGFAPRYWDSEYPSFGNANMCARMKNLDLRSCHFLTAGKKTTALTNGNESGVVDCYIRSILNTYYATFSFAGGGNKLFKLYENEVISGGDWPHTISHPTYGDEKVRKLVLYKDKLFYFYSHMGGGTIGRYDIFNDEFDDDWGDDKPSGAGFLESYWRYPAVIVGSYLYFGHKTKVGYLDLENDVLNLSALELGGGYEIFDLEWNYGRILIGANLIPYVGSRGKGKIFIWDGYSLGWEDEIFVPGKFYSFATLGKITFVFYEDDQEITHLGMLTGNRIKDVAVFKLNNHPPYYYQVCIQEPFIVFAKKDTQSNEGKIYFWGNADRRLDPILFQFGETTYPTIEGIGNPFGDLIISSGNDTNFELGKLNTLTTDAYWKSINYDVQGRNGSQIDELIIFFEKLTTSGQRVDIKIDIDEGKESWEGSVSYDQDGEVCYKKFPVGRKAYTFRVELSFTNNTASVFPKIKGLRVLGHYLD